MKEYLILLVLLAAGGLARGQSLFDSLYAVRTLEVYFPSGSTALTAESQPAFDSMAAFVRRHPRVVAVRITAHTDSVGKMLDNEVLAQRRGLAVEQRLLACGVAPEKICYASLGERYPAAANGTANGRQRNRRATVEVLMTVPMTTLSGRVLDSETGSGIPATVHFRSKTRSDFTQTDPAGNYTVRLPKDTIVKLEAVAKDYFFGMVTLRVFGNPALYQRYKVSTNIELPRVRVGAKAVLRDLLFIGAESVLLKASEAELPKVVRFMELNPGVCIEIAGHVNNPLRAPGDIPQHEWALSENRARTVYDYLVTHGISPNRLNFKGYGNTEMLFPNAGATEEEQQQNRRVEVRIVQER